MDPTALVGVLGALIGAGASTVTTWLAQRGERRRELAQRSYNERHRWTEDKRGIFRDLHVVTNDWAHLLRRVARDEDVTASELRAVERAFHAQLYEAALVAGPEVCELVDDAEDELLRLTAALGRPTEYGPAAPDPAVKTAVATDDFLMLRDIRLRMMTAMRRELGSQ
jgi:hypothetical protein